MARKKYPRCVKCGKITEVIAHTGEDDVVFGCKTPKKCGWKEYKW